MESDGPTLWLGILGLLGFSEGMDSAGIRRSPLTATLAGNPRIARFRRLLGFLEGMDSAGIRRNRPARHSRWESSDW